MLSKVSDLLNDAVNADPNLDETAFIDEIIEKYVTYDNLKHAIDTDTDLLTAALEKVNIYDPIMGLLFRGVCRKYWFKIENYLLDANKIYEKIAKKPECAALLDTEEGNRYLNKTCKRTYDFIYNFVWGT